MTILNDDFAIAAEGLGKSYLLGHNTKSERYTALRDVLARGAREFARKTRDMFTGRAIVQGDEVEEFWALKNVSFELKRGERLGIIGRNGAGKSTLLKLLSRITEPTEGRIRINGRVASLLEVGTGFHPELTGRENIYLNGSILGMSRREIQRKFDEIVDFAGVETFLDTPVKRYSSGMYVRLAFAVAAHLEPEILIVDEVLAVGDAEFQKKCLGKMEAVGRDGRTVLFVSHNMAAIQNLCDRAILLGRGQILKDDVPSVVIGEYASSQYSVMDVASDGSVSLSDKRERVYQGKVFSSIMLTDSEGIPGQHFKMGDSLHVRVALENTAEFNGADYCVAILDMNDRWIASYATWMYPEEKSVAPRAIDLNLPKIQLVPGQYKIYLSTAFHAAGAYIDRIENAVLFEVVEADIFGAGKIYSADCGVFFTDAELRVE